MKPQKLENETEIVQKARNINKRGLGCKRK